ncbi:MAG: 4-hydroxythreonine-4-phosphate dehydrogenase PdxA [Spirochaetia bacterium]|nr:4-hydroxythreonine-4-phosphate dehydrogenase PdxA [Spirochaetia bacterium]
MKRLKIAITMGDPAGIGPEIIAKMHLLHDVYKEADVFVIGDLFPMLSAQRTISAKLNIKPITNINNMSRDKNTINLLDMKILKLDDYCISESSPKAGMASFLYLKKAIELAHSKKIDGFVTAPINKHSLHLAGLKYPGHTEILAEFTKTKDFAMMLMSDKLRVVLATTHCAIADVPKKINTADLVRRLKLIDLSLRKDFGLIKPSIAVCGLNPHAGEQGAFGREEIMVISPAIKKARALGINADGPHPADTLFERVVNHRTHDAVLAMYHDQGLVPLKMLSFETGVNVTLGLPIVRTSPDHGTAYDIAGTGKAHEGSMWSAFETAVLMAKNRKK